MGTCDGVYQDTTDGMMITASNGGGGFAAEHGRQPDNGANVSYRYALAGLATAAIIGSACTARPSVDAAPPSPPSVAIYAALLTHAFPHGRPDTVFLEERTASYRQLPPDNWLRRGKAVVPPPLPERLHALSAAPHPVVRAALPPWPVRLLEAEQARRLGREGLGAVRILTITPIAFADDSSQALVYYDARCGGLCGGGYELWFVRDASGRWQLRQEMAHWRS